MSSPFSEREKDVLKLLLQGKSNKQIALELGISNRTVEFHLSNIYAKLGVNSRSETILKLTDGQLRESPGGYQVKSTVDDIGDSTENGFKSKLRRSPVKKLYYILGGLFVTILIVTMAVRKNQPAQNLEVQTATPAEEVSSVQVSTEVLSPTPLPVLQPTNVAIPPHTVNGYTATIESYYADVSRIIFQVRVTGGGVNFGDEHYFDRISSPDMYDENGTLINASTGMGPAADPALYQIGFEPVTLLTGDRVKGQFAFDIVDPPDYNKKLAQFSFDFDIPFYPEARFYPKQTFTANGLEILLDSVAVTPTFTQVYLCLAPPSFAPWTIGVQTTLQINGQEVLLFNASELFSSATGSYWGARSEPYWVPPVKIGSCYKVGFQAGSTIPTSLTLTIPQLEKLELEVDFMDQLTVNYPGMSPRQAYSKYLEEHGNAYKGPWVFTIELIP
jgi:DNA-binding CsgD family transcriptional regulator